MVAGIKHLIDTIVTLELNESFRGFSLKRFKQIIDEDVSNAIKYAKKHLPLLGVGSTRIVFTIGKGKILKIIRPNANEAFSVLQNKTEIETYEKYKDSNYFARIFDYDKTVEPAWLVSEAVKIISEHVDLKKLFNASEDFLENVEGEAEYFPESTFEEALKKAITEDKYIESIDELTEYDLKLAKNIFAVVKNHNIVDISSFDQWGFNPDGEMVIADYGIDG